MSLNLILILGINIYFLFDKFNIVDNKNKNLFEYLSYEFNKGINF